MEVIREEWSSAVSHSRGKNEEVHPGAQQGKVSILLRLHALSVLSGEGELLQKSGTTDNFVSYIRDEVFLFP